jgi:cytoskeletal protein RodZ
MSNQTKYNRREPLILEEQTHIVREDNSVASGLLLGIVIAVILGVIGAAFFFTNQHQVGPTRVVPGFVPSNNQSPSTQTTTTQKTVTTRTVIPAPEVQKPASDAVNSPAQPQNKGAVQQDSSRD